MPIVPSCNALTLDTLNILKIKSFTCPLDTSCLTTFSTVLNALYTLNITMCYILQVTEDKLSLYLGVQSATLSCTGLDLLRNGLTKIYPQIQLEVLDAPSCKVLFEEELFNPSKLGALSSALALPKETLSTSCTSPSLETLIKLMSGETYTLLFLAKPLDRNAYRGMEEALEHLHHTLNPFRDINYTSTLCTNKVSTNSSSHTHNESNTANTSATQGDSVTQNTTCSTTNTFSINYAAVKGPTLNEGHTGNTNKGNTQNTTQNNTDACSNQLSCTQATSDSDSCTCIDTLVTNHKTFNIQVDRLMKQIDLLLTHYTATLPLSIFQFGAYFLSPSVASCVRAASIYIALIETNHSPLYPSFINTWQSGDTSFNGLLTYLKMLQHPIFCSRSNSVKVEPTLPTSALEINKLFSLYKEVAPYHQ